MRVTQIAQDLVAHFEDRLEAMDGKAMIVCMSRRICVELHEELVRLRPDWYDEDDSKGQIKVVMTGSATDPPDGNGTISITLPETSNCDAAGAICTYDGRSYIPYKGGCGTEETRLAKAWSVRDQQLDP